MKHLISSILFLGLSNVCHVQAQNGWDYIKQNDNRQAKQVFTQKLKTDSLDADALKGMIYLSNISKDDYDIKKYTARLLRQVKDPAYYYLFGHASEFSADNKLKPDMETPVKFEIENQISEASSAFYNRKFEESDKIMASTVSIFNWSYIGPFKNMNGYGYELVYPVEKNNFEFDITKSYINYNKVDLKWVMPQHTNKNGQLNFETHCITDRDAVYYANTYVELKSDQKVQLRIAREYPVKIWIDNQLVFANREHIHSSWDAEMVEMDLKSGWHRILVKYCKGSFFTGKNGGSDYGDYSNYESFDGETSLSLSDLTALLGRGSYNSSSENICFRLTDVKGKVIECASTNTPQAFSTAAITPVVKDREELRYFKSLIDKNPNDWFNYYLYYKAAIKGGYTSEVEEFAYLTWQKNSDKVFFKYITNEIFRENGKKEKADKIISGIDLEKCPVFTLMYDDLKQIDQENEPNLYISKVDEIRTVAPSNLFMMRRMLEHYDKQGLVAERKSKAKELIKSYPRFEYILKEYLEDDNKPTDYDIGNRSEYSAKKAEKESAKNIKKYFSLYDYNTLIKKYKGLNQPANALKLYNEIIAIEPDNFDIRREKAEYLFNLEKHEEALQELEVILASQPYNSKDYELMGDIFKDKENNAKALECYKLAKQYESDEGGYSLFGMEFGGGNGLEEKIDKIQGQKLLKTKFNSRNLDEIIADESGLEKYSDEESVILGFVYDIMLEKDGTANLFSKMAIKVLTDAGAKNWTEYDFSFLGNLSTCKVLKANGSEFTPDKSGGFVVFKNLEPGDIIKLEGNYKWNVGTELGKELIQFNYLNFHVPIRYAKIEYGVPGNSDFNYLLHNIPDNVEKRNVDGLDFFRWEYKDLKKVAQEDAIVDQTDMYGNIMVSTMNDWSPVVDWFKAKTYRKLEPNYELRAVRDSIIRPGMTDEEKVIAIYNYITKEIKYSYTRLLQSNYIPKNTDLTISSRIGDCKDVASLMIALLQMEGIESYYCLVKTNQFFHQKTLPSLYFDHVIAAYKLNGKMNFVDLTTDYYPYYVLNENDVNAWGLLIKDGEKELFQLPSDHLDPKKNLTIHEVTATLGTDKSVDIKVNTTFNGLTGGMLRELNAMKSRDNFEQEVLFFLGDGQFDNFSLEDYKFENVDEITAPLKGTFNFKAMNFSDNIVDIYFTRVPMMQGMKTTNIFSSSKRFNTIELSEIFRVTPSLQKIKLDFPKGTTVRKMPADVNIENEFVKYSLKFSKTATGIYVERYQEFKTSEIKAADFKKFRELYLALLDHDRTKIGLIVN
ncbi:MAG TPA: transglutaminase domain-containing protein [Flavobacteriales bacterium]|nr:transglutaminase domain-containing protein [Flavobacteriales bacterium]